MIGKTASCAAMALPSAAYVAPSHWQRPVAVTAVVALAAVDDHGVTRTAWLTRVIVTVVLLPLTTVVVAVLVGGQASAGRVRVSGGRSDWHGVLQSAGLLFSAFAGLARAATTSRSSAPPAPCGWVRARTPRTA